MKAVLILILGLFLIQADALKCWQSDCTELEDCSSSEVTCGSGEDSCFVIMTSYPRVEMRRGCIPQKICDGVKRYYHSAYCCTTDLCNKPYHRY